MLSAWRLCSAAMDVLFELRPRVTIQIWLKLRPALPYPNRSNWLSEGLLRAKLSMIVELSNDRSRSFSDDGTSKEERFISKRSAQTVLYYFDFAECSLCWCAGYWQAAEDEVKHCQIQKARQLKQNSVRLQECPTFPLLHVIHESVLLRIYTDISSRSSSLSSSPAGSLYWGSSHSSTEAVSSSCAGSSDDSCRHDSLQLQRYQKHDIWCSSSHTPPDLYISPSDASLLNLQSLPSTV